MKKPRSMASAGKWLPAAVLAALVVPVPHANAVTAVECSGRYTLTADTVTDNDTGLTWERTANPTADTWDNAQTYCQNLPLASGGWRLPTVFELQTLVDDSVTAPALDPIAFEPTTEDGLFWTSTRDATYMAFAWMVNFGDNGYPFQLLPKDCTDMSICGYDGQNRVRCVR